MVTGGWRGIGRAVAERLADGQAVIAEFDLDVLDRILCTNVGGTFVVNQLAARRVRAGGAIVNFSSSVEKIAPARPSSFAPPGVLAPAHCRPDAHSRSRTRVPERTAKP
jgi:NAD(P)-dependent dehydrogenase (short-subunit alcohol dehydrogenase family)